MNTPEKSDSHKKPSFKKSLLNVNIPILRASRQYNYMPVLAGFVFAMDSQGKNHGSSS